MKLANVFCFFLSQKREAFRIILMNCCEVLSHNMKDTVGIKMNMNSLLSLSYKFYSILLVTLTLNL